MKRILLLIVVFAIAGVSLAQAQNNSPSVPWRFGAHVGANINMSGVGYSSWLRADERPAGSFIPYVRNDGNGLGLYLGLNAQYNFLDWLGVQARLSYDMRSLTANDDQSYTKLDGTNFDDEYCFNIGLINFEALAKLYLGDRFHFTGGGGLGFKMDSYYTYKLDGQESHGSEVDIPGSALVGSFVGGFGYEIPLGNTASDPQWFLTPFVEASYMVGMREVDFEFQSGFADGLSILTVRAGIEVAMGSPERDDIVAPVGRLFQITPPEDGIYTNRTTNEYFPIRPYVVFDSGSTEIPTEWNNSPRYNLIDAGDRDDWIQNARNTVMDAEHAADADENRYMQGQVYYNILNIVGYRLQQTPTADLTLIGSDPVEKNGEDLANTVKAYLTGVWGIDGNRIAVKSQVNPRKPAGTPRTPAEDRPLAVKENRRVEIVSSDPSIMRRAVIRAESPAREENEIHIEIITNEDIDSWQVSIKGEGQSKSFGPFTSSDAYMDPTGLLTDDNSDGDYVAEVIATTADGRTLTEDAEFSLRLNEDNALAERFALTFEFSEDDPEARSEDFLEDIAPRIPNGATVIISGFTDNIGSDDYNMKLSKERANQAATILKRRLNELGKKANIRAIGFGEDSDRHPYTNVRPEGRMYNRTVIVDIIP